MFGFPVNLQDSNVQKFSNDSDNGIPKVQQREVFYSVRDGDWTDISIWQTASGRVGKFPSRFDDVYIKHRVVNDSGFDALIEVNNLFISGRLEYGTNGGLFYARKFYVYGNIQCTGILDLTNQRTGASDSHTFRLYGYNNRIDNFIPSNGNGFVDYYSTNFIPQPVLNLPYSNVSFNGPGIKYLTGNLTTTGDLIIRTFGSDTTYDNTLDLRVWNLNVGGNLGVGKVYWDLGYGKGSLIRTGGAGGNVVIGGLCSVNGYMDLSGCDIEFKNGLTYSSQNSLSNIVSSSTDTWRFTTTASQFMNVGNTLSGQITINAQIIVGSGVTLNLARGYAGPVWRFNNSINGVDGTSKLVNQCEIYLQTQVAAENIMRTGVADFSTFINTTLFIGDYSAIVSNNITTFHHVGIYGTGTKSLGVNTTLNGNLVSYGNLDCATYDLVVNGTSNLFGAPSGYPLSKTGAGSITFIGKVYGSQSNMLDFSGGNPSVELRNGMDVTNINSTTRFKSGTGTWTFTTNNQSILTNTGGADQLTFDCPVVIAAGITLTLVGYNIAQNRQTLIFNHPSSINGASSTSQLISYSTLQLNASDTLMTTGIFNPSLNIISLIIYNYNSVFTLPYSSYANLYVAGTGKKLGSNTTIYGNLNSGTNTEFDLSNYDIIVHGITNAAYSPTSYSMKKTGVGNLLFIGELQLHGPGPTSYSYDFSGGNPNVELRGGISMVNSVFFKSGTGTFSFTTNNQGIFNNVGGSNVNTFDCNIFISSNIILTLYKSSGNGNVALTFNGTLNGGNASSSFIIGTNNNGSMSLQYNNATQPMATGILDTSTNAHTWIYGNGNQDIKGGPTTLAKQVYRNLTLNGGGTKTLQGYVSVLNTYTLTSPATLANNGFTLTNP